jgi:nicotine oxidoreductase
VLNKLSTLSTPNEIIVSLLLGHLSITGGFVGNSGSPEVRKYRGDRGLILGGQRRKIRGFHSSASPLKETNSESFKEAWPTGLAELTKIIKESVNNSNSVFKNVSRIIAEPEFLKFAYGLIKSKSGNMTPGIDTETLDGVDLQYFKTLSKEIGSGSFKFKPARRNVNPKDKGGTGPLSIASPRDKIVHSAMKIILEAVFEPQFSNFSHGFRSGRGTHTALYQARGLFTEVNWFIEADISKCFETLPQHLMIEEVKKKIEDQVFIDLIYKSFNAGYIDTSNAFKIPQIWSPQGSIISPILCNILLNIVDKWLTELSDKFSIGIRRKSNPIYTKLIRDLGKKLPHMRKNIRTFIHQNKIRPYLANDPNFKRMRFVRYADDFIIGVIGSHKDCVEIKDSLALFLNHRLGLELSLAKTRITHSSEDKAQFLGFDLSITPYEKRQLVRSKRRDGSVRLTAQTSRPQILAPITKIVEKLASKGYCKNGKKGTPTRVGKLIHLSLPMIINHYLSIGRGLINYYSCSDNFTVFKARIAYILKYSCALTFASKLRLKTLKGVYSKYGYDLKVSELVKNKNQVVAEFKDETLTSIKKGFNLEINDYVPISILNLASRSYPRTRILFEGECTVCASKEDLEVHHLKHLRKQNQVNRKVDYMTNIMRRMNRKQILICKSCHIKIHQGKHLGPGL